MGLSDHVVVLDYGRKVGDGPPDEVRTNPDVVAAYLGTTRTFATTAAFVKAIPRGSNSGRVRGLRGGAGVGLGHDPAFAG